MGNTPLNDLMLMLGRLEGKMDSMMTSLSTQTSRMDRIEQLQNALDSRVTTIEATKSTGRNWFGGIMSIIALALAVMSLTFEVGNFK
jgi:hypothetical protein